MKLRSRLLPVVAALALVSAACATDGTTTDEPDDGVEDDVTTDEDDLDEESTGDEVTDDGAADDDVVDDDAADDDAADDDAAASAPAIEPSGTVTSGIEVATAEVGDHIVTDEGVTTYAAVDQRDGEVICVADCAQVWLPVIADGDLDVGEGIDPELVTTITLDDGREQVAIDGAPLHAFVADGAAGDLRGQGSAERWYVLSPDGALLGAADAEGAED